MSKKTEEVRVNDRIRAKSVRLIGVDGTQLGIMSTREALETAGKDGLDLVEVAPNSDPPVCRILDYGKFKYEARKKGQEGRKKGKTFQVKEIKVRPRTEDHDLGFKIKNLKKFLEKKNRVKVTVIFRGRELAYMDAGIELLQKIADETAEEAVVDQAPKREGRIVTMLLSPK